MKIGVLKSKVEQKLSSAYVNGTLKSEIKNFKKLVLENKSLSQLFYLYDELNENKGLTEEFANEFLKESSESFQTISKKINKNKKLENWVEGVEVKNIYENIDNFFYGNVTNLENKILSKKFLVESLKKEKKTQQEIINLPISTMINVANKNILSHVESLNEEEKKEFYSLISKNQEELNKDFTVLKEDVIGQLENLELNSDVETKQKISETIQKVNDEKLSLTNFLKLKNLKENL